MKEIQYQRVENDENLEGTEDEREREREIL